MTSSCEFWIEIKKSFLENAFQNVIRGNDSHLFVRVWKVPRRAEATKFNFNPTNQIMKYRHWFNSTVLNRCQIALNPRAFAVSKLKHYGNGGRWRRLINLFINVVSTLNTFTNTFEVNGGLKSVAQKLFFQALHFSVYGMKLLVPSQTSPFAPLKCRNG